MSELHTTIGDYRDLEILPDSVIYCDPPYKDTADYGMEFDHEAFYQWCERQTQPVFISEYWCPPERFFCIAEKKRTSTFSATNNSKIAVERVYMPNKWKEWWNKRHKLSVNSLFTEDEFA